MPVTAVEKRAAVDLAALAYLAEPNPVSHDASIEARLAKIPASSNGPWTTVWGPGENEGVFAYIALGKDRTTYALVLRCNTGEIKAHEFIYDWLLNGETLVQVPWTSPRGSGVKVSAGLNRALAYVIALPDQDTHKGLLDFFRAVVTANGSLRLIVTGHGLGGALSQLTAQWLYFQLAEVDKRHEIHISPLTFGAPTAGNQQFAMLIERTFPANYALVNTLDIVPMAWWNLDRIQQMFPWPAQPIAEFGVGVAGLITIYKDSLAAAYKRVIAPPPETFDGWTPSSPDTFEHTMAANHAISIYRAHVTMTTDRS